LYESGIQAMDQGHHPRNVYGNQQKQEEAYRYTVAAGKNRDGSKGASILANNVKSTALSPETPQMKVKAINPSLGLSDKPLNKVPRTYALR